MSALLGLLATRTAGPLAALAALLLAAGLAWQTARIEGWPLVGRGLKAEVSRLEAKIAADDGMRATAEAAMLAARALRAAQAENQARAYLRGSRAEQTRVQTLIEKVPVYVSKQSDRGCVLPWGVVRLLDAAASGNDADRIAARIAPGRPDDAPSDVALSEAVALLAGNLAAARDNESQLRHLQRAVDPED